MAKKRNHDEKDLLPLTALINDAKRCMVSQSLVLDELELSIRSLYENHGMEVTMIDMPDVGKMVDHGLSCGTINFADLPQYSESGDVSPFLGLVRILFDEQGSLSEAVAAEHVHHVRAICYLYKKVVMECPTEAVTTAYDEFLTIEQELRAPTLPWGSTDISPRRLSFSDVSWDCLPMFDRILDRVSGILGQFRQFDYTDVVPKHGPGSVSDQLRGEDKFSAPYWPAKLQAVFPEEYFLFPRGDLDCEARQLDLYGGEISVPKSREEPRSRVIPVPKTLKGPRLITVEPAFHQFLQQGLMKWLRVNMHPVLRASIDFNSQEPSREGALRASMDGLSATVDLSSASDRLSCWSVERAIHNHGLLEALNATRTASVVLRRPRGDLELTLKKFAGMGSAVTFPVQSIVYCMVCISSVLYARGLAPTLRNIRDAGRHIRVFGDDILIPTEAVQTLASALDVLQLRVNAGKTHVSGKFRESCGMDAFDGIQVNPVYLASTRLGKSPAEVASWIEISNNAYKAGFWTLARWMDEQLKDCGPVPVCCVGAEVGLHLTTLQKPLWFQPWVYGCRKRRNADWHCAEYRVLTLGVRTRLQVRGTSLDLLDYWLQHCHHQGSDAIEVEVSGPFTHWGLAKSEPPTVGWQPGFLRQTRQRLAVEWVPASYAG